MFVVLDCVGFCGLFCFGLRLAVLSLLCCLGCDCRGLFCFGLNMLVCLVFGTWRVLCCSLFGCSVWVFCS